LSGDGNVRYRTGLVRAALAVLAVLLVLPWSRAAQAQQPAVSAVPAQAAQQYAQAVQQLYSLINQERARAGLAPLRLDPVLTRLAEMKSQDMVALNYFSHYSPTYGYPYTMEYRAGVRARYMGAENIAASATAQAAHALLMASPGHRRNILDPRFTDVGIGVVPGRWGLVITQLFIGK